MRWYRLSTQTNWQSISSPPGKNQKAALFRRGKATSCTPSCVGNKKFAKAPKSRGIIMKKTIMTPCAVAKLKYCRLSPTNTPAPG